MRIDLHTHSVASDGTDAPAALVAAAARAGLDVVALTDHDTTRGWAEAEAAVPVHGVALVRGAEISCLVDRMSVHLLSYLHDPEHAGLLEEGERTREARLQRARAMVDLIAEDLDLTWADVEAQTVPGTTVGRPHIADALAARGHVADRSAAFATVLAAGSRYYVPHYAPDAAHAVRLVRAAGGVPVLAHPGALVRGRILSDEAIGRLVDAGLAGIEVDHRDHDDAQRRRLAGIAAEAGLVVTGSSDYHGAGKPNVLGERTTSPEALEAIEDQGRLPVVRP
ncbi:PHP domain-containing protein [Actinotalea ferrariae]|uniref:PHP domain-containing protein n=1 Tax=Actinotalea ferrariae TaxID=1386098 RepID=UPI001C8B6B1A|nr:PHP domain-containing protein [Actinotalea ferrariae]MBX9246567.1 PHP domain-containing protein [Actinotalea ferrariae]